MFNYGDKVKYGMMDKVGTVIGFMQMDFGHKKLLVKFDIDHEIWVPEVDLEKVDD